VYTCNLDCIVEAIHPLIRSENSYCWGELLYRGAMIRRVDQWMPWYRGMADRIGVIQRQHPYDRISINIDSAQMMDPEIEASLYALAGLPVAIEWTENLAVGIGAREIMVVGQKLEALRREQGFPIVLDDVGTGQDTLGRLCALQLQPDAVKIDGTIFQLARSSSRIRQLLSLKVQIYEQQMKTPVVIEWIETPDDLLLAQDMGATWGQGYLWAYEGFLPGWVQGGTDARKVV